MMQIAEAVTPVTLTKLDELDKEIGDFYYHALKSTSIDLGEFRKKTTDWTENVKFCRDIYFPFNNEYPISLQTIAFSEIINDLMSGVGIYFRNLNGEDLQENIRQIVTLVHLINLLLHQIISPENLLVSDKRYILDLFRELIGTRITGILVLLSLPENKIVINKWEEFEEVYKRFSQATDLLFLINEVENQGLEDIDIGVKKNLNFDFIVPYSEGYSIDVFKHAYKIMFGKKLSEKAIRRFLNICGIQTDDQLNLRLERLLSKDGNRRLNH